jgi:hypothetical protein
MQWLNCNGSEPCLQKEGVLDKMGILLKQKTNHIIFEENLPKLTP